MKKDGAILRRMSGWQRIQYRNACDDARSANRRSVTSQGQVMVGVWDPFVPASRVPSASSRT